MTPDRYQCCSCLAFLQKLSIDIAKRFQAFHCSNIDSESKLIDSNKRGRSRSFESAYLLF